MTHMTNTPYNKSILGGMIPKRNVIIDLFWEDVTGKLHNERFMRMKDAIRLYGMAPSWVHTWTNPTEGLRRFLSHCPLHRISIQTEEVQCN